MRYFLSFITCPAWFGSSAPLAVRVAHIKNQKLLDNHIKSTPLSLPHLLFFWIFLLVLSETWWIPVVRFSRWVSLWWFDNRSNRRQIWFSGIVFWTRFLSDMSELCLMASHGYPSALLLHHQHNTSREIKVPYDKLLICEISITFVLLFFFGF